MTLVKGDLAGFARARALSRATMRNIRQNLVLAFVYNVLGIPLAAGVASSHSGAAAGPAGRSDRGSRAREMSAIKVYATGDGDSRRRGRRACGLRRSGVSAALAAGALVGLFNGRCRPDLPSIPSSSPLAV